MSLNTEKLILLLDGTDQTSNSAFISNLVSMGIYNFTKNVEGIQYLYNSPNSYRDVAQFHMIGNGPAPVQNQGVAQVAAAPVMQQTVAAPHAVKVIGIKNVTRQSGASSLVYMMKKALSKKYGVVGIEVDKNDFSYFRDNDLISTITADVGSTINRYGNKDVILVDINNSVVAEGLCHEVLYLIEPSIIKLQKLMALNATALQGLRNKKVILNQSLLSANEVANFEYEARIKVFYNLVPLNERDKDWPELNKLLSKLGFDI